MSEYITLKDNRDFSGLYRRGKSFVGPVLVTYVLKNKSDNLRFGITTGKKIGKAVRRTRSRRVIREAYYKLYPDMTLFLLPEVKHPMLKALLFTRK